MTKWFHCHNIPLYFPRLVPPPPTISMRANSFARYFSIFFSRALMYWRCLAWYLKLNWLALSKHSTRRKDCMRWHAFYYHYLWVYDQCYVYLSSAQNSSHPNKLSQGSREIGDRKGAIGDMEICFDCVRKLPLHTKEVQQWVSFLSGQVRKQLPVCLIPKEYFYGSLVA